MFSQSLVEVPIQIGCLQSDRGVNNQAELSGKKQKVSTVLHIQPGGGQKSGGDMHYATSTTFSRMYEYVEGNTLGWDELQYGLLCAFNRAMSSVASSN